MEFVLQGVTSEAKPSNGSFILNGFSLFSCLTPNIDQILKSRSLTSENSQPSHLLLREGSGYYGFSAQEQMYSSMLGTNHAALCVPQLFSSPECIWSWTAWVRLPWLWIPPVSPLPTSIVDR